MRHFCTLFDSNYLLKGLALYESLTRHADDFHLWVLCMDDEALDLLGRLGLEHATLIPLGDFEDPSLAAVKGDRSRGEYCWTCTPSLPLYVLRTSPEIDIITYLDADLYFFSDADAIFEEFGDASIGLVEHRYSSALAVMAETHGIYNVECMVFRNDAEGVKALEWWRERCIEWCYNRVEDGKFGDQKYLDDWPERFSGVRVLRGKGVGLAPWNIAEHRIEASAEALLVDGEPLVFYHFHQFALLDGGKAYRPTDGGFLITPRELRLLYGPYSEALRRALVDVRGVAPGFAGGIEARSLATKMRDLGASVRNTLRALKKR
ncbi:MAG: hypothetical protein HY876_03860 [Coriobacteriales bacterium]|nr:hypothetical protein [Coriobacteriales bacterium]